MDKTLQLILEQLQKLNDRVGSLDGRVGQLEEGQSLIKTQLSETNEIVRAIRDRQDETDVKLDTLSMDVNKIHGEIEDIKDHLQFNTKRITDAELEIFKLKK